jgi:transposase
LGRSRGGFSTKVHALVDTQGRPLHVELTPGQQHDCTVAKEIVAAHARGKALIADTAYDSDEIIAQVRAQQMKPVICPHPRRNKKPRLDRKKYRKRYRVEIFFHDIKRFRAVATRFEKRAIHYLSVVQLVSALLWLPPQEAVAS